jgi:hypothetical protein
MNTFQSVQCRFEKGHHETPTTWRHAAQDSSRGCLIHDGAGAADAEEDLTPKKASIGELPHQGTSVPTTGATIRI